MKIIKEKILAGSGIVSTILWLIGAMGWCCTPLVVGFFALFGITSTAFLITYNSLFLLIGTLSLILALVFYLKNRDGKEKCCKK